MGIHLSVMFPWWESVQEKKAVVVMPFKSKHVDEIARKFLLSPQDMIFFHQIFREMDTTGNGYISESNVFEFVEEEKTSVLSPYIAKFFQLIEKESADRVCFVEWVPAICAFCLFTHEQIIKFVFGMIDDDHDEVISKKDIIKFLIKERYGAQVFPFNQVHAIELLEVDRADRIKYEQFKRIELQIPFLCYPGFRLQEVFRERLNGSKFWKNTFSAIFASEQEREKQKQQEIIDEQVNRKKKQELAEKESNFQQIIGSKSDVDSNLFKPDLLPRLRLALETRTYMFELSEPKNRANPRRFSDGMLDIVFLAPKQHSRARGGGDSSKKKIEGRTTEDSPSRTAMPMLLTSGELSKLQRANSDLYIKMPFALNPSEKNDDDDDRQNLQSQQQQQQQQHGRGSSLKYRQSHARQSGSATPRNPNGPMSPIYATESGGGGGLFKNDSSQQLQQQMNRKRRVVPRSLKNTGASSLSFAAGGDVQKKQLIKKLPQFTNYNL